MPPPAEPLVLSVSGLDRPGILAELAASLAAAGIPIVDIEQATLQDFLALSFLVDLGNDAARAQALLRDVIPLAGKLGLAVDVRPLGPEQLRRLKEGERHVLTVISERPSARVVAELARVIAGHGANIVSIRRLAEEDLRAGEFVLDATRTPDPEALRADILATAETLGVDVGLAREDVFRVSKRVVVFDMDSTLVAGEIIDMLAVKAGVAEEIAALTREAMEGRLDFAESLRRRVALLRGLPEGDLLTLAAELPLTPGAGEVMAVLRRLGYRLGIVSGGFAPFAEALRRRFELDYAVANRLEIEGGRLTGRVIEPILDAEGKADTLREIARREGISLDQIVGVGDGANDVPMLKAAGLGVAFRGKEVARRSADAAILRNHFEGLLYLLGVSGRDRRRVERG